MAVTLVDDRLSVDPGRRAALGEHHGIEPEPHGAALVGDAALLGEEIDHRVRGHRVEFRGVGAAQPADVPGEFDDRTLHAQADPEVRHTPLAGVANGHDLPYDTPGTEAAGHEDAVDVGEVVGGYIALDVHRVAHGHVHARG